MVFSQGPNEGRNPDEPNDVDELDEMESQILEGEAAAVSQDIETYTLSEDERLEALETYHADPLLEDELKGAMDELETRYFENVGGLIDVQAESSDAQLGLENIVGVAIGEEEVGGQPTGKPCVQVFVVEKGSQRGISAEALVPPDVQGMGTDVIEVGLFEALRFTRRYRPARTGASVGHYRVTAGTLGALVVNRQNQLFILSNNHVLANSNNARRGDPILQPGRLDGGRYPRDLIARLQDYISIDFSGRCNNLVDAAIARTSRNLVSPVELCGWRPKRSIHVPMPPRPGTGVKKCGRTTQFTRGRVSAVRATVKVRYGTRVACFRDQIIISPGGFSAGGDSGSLIVDDINRPLGLLFAGSGRRTIANRIDHVLSALRVRIY